MQYEVKHKRQDLDYSHNEVGDSNRTIARKIRECIQGIGNQKDWKDENNSFQSKR